MSFKSSEEEESNIPLELVQIKYEPTDYIDENIDYKDETDTEHSGLNVCSTEPSDLNVCNTEHSDLNVCSEALNQETIVKIKTEPICDHDTPNKDYREHNVTEHSEKDEVESLDNCFVKNNVKTKEIDSVQSKKRNIDMVITSSEENTHKKNKVVTAESCANETENLNSHGEVVYIKQEVDPSAYDIKDGDDDEYVQSNNIGGNESSNFNPHHRVPQQGTFIYCAPGTSTEPPDIPETYSDFMSNIPTRYSQVLYHKLLQGNRKISLDSPDRPFRCECGKTFKRRCHLQRHAQIHSGIRYSCEECGQSFYEKGTLASHLFLHCNITFNCEFCTKCFKRKSSLIRHILIHKGIKFKCEFCGKVFSDRGTLEAHSWIHKGVVHQCDLCHKYFGYKSALVKHMVRHNGIIYKCSKCDKTFNHKSSYSSHMLTHNGVDYPCKVCGKSFSYKCTLTRHLLLHEKGVVYKCEKCDQCYRNWNTFVMHKHLHEGLGHECKHCKKLFSQRIILVKHMEKMHKDS